MGISFAPNLMGPDARLSSFAVPIIGFRAAKAGEAVLPLPGIVIPEAGNSGGSAFYLRVGIRYFLTTAYHCFSGTDQAWGYKAGISNLRFPQAALFTIPGRHINLASRKLFFVPITGDEVADVILIEIDKNEIPAGVAVLSGDLVPNTADLAMAAKIPAFLEWNGGREMVGGGEALVVCGYPNDERFPDFQAIKATRFAHIPSGRPAEAALFGDITTGFSGGPVFTAADVSGLRLCGLLCRGDSIVTSLTNGTTLRSHGGNFVLIDEIIKAACAA